MDVRVAAFLLVFPILAIACSGDGQRGGTGASPTRTPVPEPTLQICVREPGPDYRGARLTGKTFRDQDLGCARFDGAQLTRITFSGGNLSLAEFRRAVLTRVTFKTNDLLGASFQGARLRDVKFDSSNLFGASFTRSQRVSVTFSNTTCPDGTNSDDAGGSCVGHGVPFS